jgi:hypothetical protein
MYWPKSITRTPASGAAGERASGDEATGMAATIVARAIPEYSIILMA